MQNYKTRFFAFLAFVVLAIGCQHQATKEQSEQPSGDATQQYQELVVEAACGECQFGLAGNDCDLAVRIDGKAYFVDGAGIDDHGDAHSDDGLCNAVRQARVQGRVEDGRFIAASFELLPSDNK